MKPHGYRKAAWSLVLWALAVLGSIAGRAFAGESVTPPDESFHLRDWLRRNWQHEAVTFPLTKAQLQHAQAGHALLGPEETPVTYQMTPGDPPSITFQVDLPPLETQRYTFNNTKSTVQTDLVVAETAETIRIENKFTGVTIRKALRDGAGPIAGIRLNSGKWVGGSRLQGDQALGEYAAKLTARGPVFAEVACTAKLGAGEWSLCFRVYAGEPVVLVDETSATPGTKTLFSVHLDTDFAPNHVFFRDGKKAFDTSVDDFIRPGTVFTLEPWLHWNNSQDQGSFFGVYNEDAYDFLTVAAGYAGAWVDPGLPAEKPQEPPQVYLRQNNTGLHLDFPLKYGRRKWMLAALDTTQCLKKVNGKYPGVTLPYQYLVKHGHFPLNLVKDYVLSWDSAQSVFPHTLYTRKEADAFTLPAAEKTACEQQLQQHRATVMNQFTMDKAIRAYYATRDVRLAQHLVRSSLRMMQESVDEFLKQHSIAYGCAPHHLQSVGAAMTMADTAIGTGFCEPKERAQLLAQAAFLAYTIARSDYWSPERGYAANPNMTTSVNGYLMAAACLVNTHPRATAWVDTAMRELRDVELHTWSDEGGGWLEAPHYAMVSYDQILGALIMANNAGISDALYTDPKVKAVINWFSKISTPPDSRTFGGYRHHPPIGNTYINEPTSEFGTLAYLFREKDPEFSAQMQWMHQQHKSPEHPGIGGGHPALAGYRDMLRDPTLPAKPPAWKSEWFPKTGVKLRNGFPSERETCLLLLAGAFDGWRSHYDDDSGSFTLWGKGRIIADDFGYYGLAPQHDHNLVSSPAANAGIFYVKHFATAPAYDYVDGARGGWRRQILFIKDDDLLAPNYFIMCDSFPQPADAVWRLYLTAAEVALDIPPPDEIDDIADITTKENPEDNVEPDFIPQQGNTQRVTVTGKDDVDTEIFFSRPDGLALKTEQKTRVSACGVFSDGRVMAMPTTQIGLIATVKACPAITTVLFPRLKTQKAPVFTALAGGAGVKVLSAAGTDYIFLSPTPFDFKQGDMAFSGTAGVVSLRKGRTILSLGAAGSIAARGHALQAEGAQSQTWRDQ
ncbi:MAG: hypothetical protein ACYC7E_12155 [Armatimonadota bacterium]